MFLGYILGKDGTCQANPDKIKHILTLEPPKNVKELRQIIGAASYWRRFCPNFSHVVSPLTRLLRKDVPFNFDSHCHESFRNLLELFRHPQVLRPFEIAQPIYIQTDASLTSIASVAMQKDIKTGKLFLLDSAGRNLKANERNFTISEVELLACVHALLTYKQYISLSTKINFYTDHISNTHYQNIRQTAAGGRMARWSQILSAHSIKFFHIPGRKLQLVDLLSRREYPATVATDIDETDLDEVILALGHSDESLNDTSESQMEHTDDNKLPFACPTEHTSYGQKDRSHVTDNLIVITKQNSNEPINCTKNNISLDFHSLHKLAQAVIQISDNDPNFFDVIL